MRVVTAVSVWRVLAEALMHSCIESCDAELGAGNIVTANPNP